MQTMRLPLSGNTAADTAPYLDTYILDGPAKHPTNGTRPAVIVCPGGAYGYVSEREAEPVAARFLAAGYHAFVMTYSVAPARFPTAVLELAEAVQLVRRNAEQWRITPGQIYIMGFSAGGHLCGTLGTLWHLPLFREAFPNAEGAPWKPDGMLLCYPVLTMGEFTHQGSRQNLLGENPDPDRLRLLSLEQQVDGRTVPAFLWHTATDEAVPVENALQYAAALRKAGRPFELHIYQDGPHGLSLSNEITAYSDDLVVPDAAGWMDLAIAWVKRQGA